ncbi:hypothetical protein [Nocardia camponoti]|nr:hypothetical protein [Nocardia camponoti]
MPNPADRLAALLVADRDLATIAPAQTALVAKRQILLVVTRRSGV